MTTFKDKVEQRNKRATLIAVAYTLAIAAMEAAVLYLVFWRAFRGDNTVSSDARVVICGICGIFTIWAFAGGWNAMRNHKTSLDMQLRDADPLELDVIEAAIQGNKEYLIQLALQEPELDLPTRIENAKKVADATIHRLSSVRATKRDEEQRNRLARSS